MCMHFKLNKEDEERLYTLSLQEHPSDHQALGLVSAGGHKWCRDFGKHQPGILSSEKIGLFL